MCFKLINNIIAALLLILTLAACQSHRAIAEQSLPNTSNLTYASTSEPGTIRVAHHSVCGSIWCALRHSFKLHGYENKPQVKKQIRWLTHHQRYIYKLAEQARPYLYFVLSEVKKRHLPGEIALVPMIESAYDPFAYSGVGAAGLWQIMPGTASGFGIKQNWWYDGRRDIYSSTKVALDYLVYLHDFFDDHWLQAIAAYDYGIGNVQDAVHHNRKHHKASDFWHLDLPHETRVYVPRLLALATILKDYQHHPIHLPKVANKPYFTRVNVGSQIDLAYAAKMAGIKLTELYQLNPGYNRWATDPAGPFYVVVPISSEQKFKQALAKSPNNKLLTWEHHVVHKGDTIGAIAHKYHTKIDLIRKVNRLQNNNIRLGKTLIIPKSAKHISKATLLSERRYVVTHRKQIGPQKIIHVVRHGESYWSIAHKYHVHGADIRFWNHLRKGQALKLKQRLIIWANNASPKVDENPGLPKIINYQVKAGDSLSRIARTHHVKIKDLQRWNHIRHASAIRIGEVLEIHLG